MLTLPMPIKFLRVFVAQMFATGGVEPLRILFQQGWIFIMENFDFLHFYLNPQVDSRFYKIRNCKSRI